MKWYYWYYAPSTSNYSTFRAEINGKWVGAPSLPENNTSYGTYTNPFVKDLVIRTSYSKLWVCYSYYTDTNICILSNTNSSYGETYIAPFRCVGVIDDNTTVNTSYLTALSESSLVGKYRFRSGTVSSFKYNSFGVPVKFSINNIKYCLFGTKQPEATIYYVPALSTSNNFVICNLNAQGYPEYTDIVSSGVVENGYTNAVFDFGDTPQSVPDIFAEWVKNNMEQIYDITYTISNPIGTTTYATLEEAPPMTHANLEWSGAEKTLTLTGENDKTYTLTWSSTTPNGKRFTGLSTKANATTAEIPVNESVDVSIDSTATLYEVYEPYNKPDGTFDIELYKNAAESNRVDKSNYLTPVATLSGALRDECSITTPLLEIYYKGVPTFNYVHIPAFNRWYYVTELTAVSKNLWRMSLQCDVLMTFKEGLYKCTAFIDRNQYDSNNLIVDNKVPLQQGQTVETVFVENDVYQREGQFLIQGILVQPYEKEE